MKRGKRKIEGKKKKEKRKEKRENDDTYSFSAQFSVPTTALVIQNRKKHKKYF